jgi:hypothetical protein
MGKSEIYQREFDYILSRKAPCVRGASVTSAFIEGQIFLLAKSFLEERGVKYKPKNHQAFRQSLNVLGTNEKLNPKELEDIEDFWIERNKTIHGIFKGMTIPEWEEQNRIVVRLGRPIIMSLDKKLHP